ncbi:MAG: putative bifunctional diguanylate cyclase/phosphodiesterase [Gammaproteobacteria bacterium]
MDVLLVEDDTHYAKLVQRTLARQKHLPFQLTTVGTLAAALSRLERERFDVILVDLNLPDAKGIESVERIALARNRVPAIVLSNNADEELAIQVIQAGAQDYLVKGPEGLSSLHRTIRYAIERKSAEFRLKQLASYDSLTNLANRQELYFQMEKACAHADRHGDMLALFLFDLDRFKLVNDCHGHHAGDALLRAFAKQLEASIRTGDTASRLGGDEFAVVLEGLPNKASASAWAEKVMERLSKPFEFEGNKFSMSASVGCALYPAHGNDVETLMHSADIAMYKVKNSGRKGVAFYDEHMDQTMVRRREMESAIRESLEQGEFQPYFQPEIALDTFEVKGFELLCRWVRPNGEVVLPGEFMPIAKAIQLMPEIGRSMRLGMIKALKLWKNYAVMPEHVPVSINLDEQELANESFGSSFVGDLKAAGIPGSLVRVEFNETVLMNKHKETLANIEVLHDYGVNIDIDGFGAGQASLYYLRQFKIDGLKIDQSLVNSVGEDKEGLVILKTIIGLAAELGLRVGANGLETSSQLRMLADVGCHTGQGYLVGRPMSSTDLVDWMKGPARRIESRLEGLTGSFKILDHPGFMTSSG